MYVCIFEIASNIISDLVEITGTTRTFLTSTQEMVRSRMQCICCGVAATFGGEIDLDYQCMYAILFEYARRGQVVYVQNVCIIVCVNSTSNYFT